MIIRGYNIELRRLTVHDIEMVRQWRNSEIVARYMEHREQITQQQQQEWFKKIDNIEHNYCLIVENEIPVGLIYGSDINWKTGVTGNGGIFLCDEGYFNSDIPLKAVFLMIDTGILLGLKTQFVKVLKDNSRAKLFNKKLGYLLLPGEEQAYNQKYFLDNNRYMECSLPLKSALGFTHNEIIYFKFDHPDHPASANILSIINKKSPGEKQRIRIL